MARNFVSASNMKLEIGSAILTAVPLTIHCWWRPVSATPLARLFCISDGSTNNSFSLEQQAAGAIRAKVEAGGTNTTAASTAIVTAGAWNAACVIFTSATARAAYVAGTNKGTDTANKTPSGLNTTTIGDGGGAAFANGSIAEVALWNIALTDAEVLLLAAGISPLLIHPEALVGYWPLLHGYSPEIDLIKGNNLTLSNTPTVTDHPSICYRGKP